jgi:hypothetical protein
MDIYKVLAELHLERKQVEKAILLVERMAAATRGKRPGGPPKEETDGRGYHGDRKSRSRGDQDGSLTAIRARKRPNN